MPVNGVLLTKLRNDIFTTWSERTHVIVSVLGNHILLFYSAWTSSPPC